MALSQAYEFTGKRRPDYTCSRAHGAQVVDKCLGANLPADCVVNINFPPIAADQVKGIQVTQQGRRDQEVLQIDSRKDGRGNPYFWLTFSDRRATPVEGTDLYAVYDGYISVTPLKLNMTDAETSSLLAEHLQS